MNGYFKSSYGLWRNAVTQDPNTGEMIEGWAKVADVLGRAYPASVRDTIAAAQRIGVITWTFACVPGTVRVGDEIRFNDRRLAVRAVPITSSGRRCEARCEEVQS